MVTRETAKKVTNATTSKVTVPKIKAGGTTPYDTPGAEYYAAQGIASYQAGNKPYVTATQSEYSSAAAMAAAEKERLGLKGGLSGPTMSYTGGAYPGYTPPQVKYPTAPTSGYFSSQAPDPRVTNVQKPYDTPTYAEFAAAKAIADNAKAAPQPAMGDGGGGGGGGGWGGGGDWASQMNWTSQMINWRI